MMMTFAIEKLGINTFRTKIGDSNGASLDMFKKLVCSPHLLFIFPSVCLTAVHITYFWVVTRQWCFWTTKFYVCSTYSL